MKVDALVDGKPFEITVYENPMHYAGFSIKCVECGAVATGSRISVQEYDKAGKQIEHLDTCLTGKITLDEWREMLKQRELRG